MNDAFDGLVYAPWDDDTVEALTRWQTAGLTHPYTCGRDHYDLTGRVVYGQQILEATEAGWICPHEGCGYVQRWAHAMSADPSHLDRLERGLKEILGYAG